MPEPQRITDDMLGAARAMVAAGVAMGNVAAALECSDGTLRRYGLRPDPKVVRRQRAEWARRLNKRWDHGLILAAIDAWAALYGAPPAAADWNPAIGSAAGSPGPS